MEPEGHLPCSQEPATGTCREPDKSSPYPHKMFINIHFVSHLSLGNPNGFFASYIPIKILYAFLSLLSDACRLPTTHLIRLDLITW
jgi:hypothetical protein